MLFDAVAQTLVTQRGIDHHDLRTCASARACVQLLDDGAIDVLVWDLPHLVYAFACDLQYKRVLEYLSRYGIR